MGKNATYHFNGITSWKIKQMVKLNIFIFSFFLNSIVVSNEIITIEIDGSNLPETQGEVLRGEKILKKIVANAMAILLKDNCT